jgi:hypothetical protein
MTWSSGTSLDRLSGQARQCRITPCIDVINRMSRVHTSKGSISIEKGNTQELLGEKRRRSAWQVRSKTEDNGWHLTSIGRGCRDGQRWRVYVTGFGKGCGNMLEGQEYRTLGRFLGFREVVNRMDSDSQGESTQNEHQAECCRAAPSTYGQSHDDGYEHEEHEGQRRPGQRWR